MENKDFHQNGTSHHDDDDDLSSVPDVHIGQKIRERRAAPKRSGGIIFGLSANELIGYSVAVMFGFLGVIILMGMLIPIWATREYRYIFAAVMFLYGIYRGVVTFTRSEQRKRTQSLFQHRESLGIDRDEE
jgi:hypothetical protein